MRLRPAALAAIVIGTFGLPDRPAHSTDVVPDIPPLPSWASPLALQPMGAYRQNRPVTRPKLGLQPASLPSRRASPGAYRITEAAVAILSVTGRVRRDGRDTTADIGKPLLGINNAPYTTAVQGGIR